MRVLIPALLLAGLAAGCVESHATPDPKAAAPGGVVSELPALAMALSAKHTTGFLAIQRPSRLFAWLDAFVDRLTTDLPEAERAQIPPAMRDPAERKALLGFDPSQDSAWAAAGFDPQGGAGMVFDARLTDPILVFKVRDQAAILKTLKRWGAQIQLGKTSGGITELRINDRPGLMGVRAGYTFIVAQQNQRAAFAAMLKPDAPLAQDAAFKRAFSDGIIGFWLTGYANAAGIANHLKARTPKVASVVDFYRERFQAVALAVGDSGATSRLVASPKGVSALRQIFVPKSAPPTFSKYTRANSLTMRFDLNVDELFDGVLALIPEEMARPRATVAIGKNAIALTTGAPYEDLAAALTGHVALSMKAELRDEPPPMVVMLGVKDDARLDAWLQQVVKALQTVHQAAIRPGKVGGIDGYLFQGSKLSFGVVRHDGLLFLGTLAEVEAALATQGDLSPGAAQRVNSPAVYGFFMPFDAMLNEIGTQTPPQQRQVMQSIVKSLWQGDLFVSHWMVDDRGINLGEGPEMVALGGVLAAIAIPAFMKYIRRSKTVEAAVHVRQIYDGAMAYGAAKHVARDGKPQPPHFPKSAPLTPATTACVDGQSVKRPPDPSLWIHPTWQALGFTVTTPSYYQYEFISDGQKFTARAIGDLDCDGVLSTFERVGIFDETGELQGGAGLYRANELE